MRTWLNGRFVEGDEARVSVFDAGFQHAVGLFETMLARHGAVFRVDAHVGRLVDSAAALRLSDRLHPDALAEAVEHVARESGLEAARLRLTITGGDLNMLQAEGRSQQDPTVLIVAQPPTAYPDAFFSEGVTVAIATARANPYEPTAGHKTLSYWPRIRMLQEAAMRGAGEAIWLGIDAQVTCACVSNVFCVVGNRLLTPAARGEEARDAGGAAPVRPGVTREAVCQLAPARGLAVERGSIDLDTLLGADEVFLTNSSWGVLPVVAVERTAVGDGRVGERTADLRHDWLRLVDEETAARAAER